MESNNAATKARARDASAAVGPSDARLCAIAERGGSAGERAFTELWRRHHQYVVHFCALRLGNRADAEDVAQNVFLKAHRGLSAFRGRSRLRTWLTAIAIHECTDHCRRERRHGEERRRETAAALHAVTAPEAFEEDGSRADGRLLELLLELPLHIREVLFMRYFRELGFEDIANELGLGLSASKMRVYRAVERLRMAHECA